MNCSLISPQIKAQDSMPFSVLASASSRNLSSRSCGEINFLGVFVFMADNGRCFASYRYFRLEKKL